MKNRPSMLLPVPRSHTVTPLLCALLLVLLVLSATVGKQTNLLPQLPSLIFRQASDTDTWLFWQLWLPRTLVAAGVGAALALSGGVFQMLTRNPLGSPDIIGVNSGAAAGAVAVTLIWPGSLPVMAGAFIGSLAVLLLVLAANGRRLNFTGGVIVSGLAVSAAAAALVQFGLTGVRQEDAFQMAVWLSGSLAQRGWDEAVLIWTVLPILGLMLAALARPLGVMGISPVMASGLGISVGKTAWGCLLAATALATAAVVAAGPVTFLALAAPHLARRLLKTGRPMLFQTGMTGAVLLLASDLAARLLPFPVQLSVGVFTAAIGGLYLCLLLFAQWRK